MALETLKDVKTIDGFEVGYLDENGEVSPGTSYIFINHIENFITFQIQRGPIKENGINGCQVDTMIATAKKIIEGFNKKIPCRENSITITKLDEALLWLRNRKAERESRGVEGRNLE